MKQILAFVFVGALAMGVAQASIIPVFQGVSSSGSGVYTYSYDLYVESPGQRIQFTTVAGPGGVPAGGFDNHFTFFDFNGYINGSAACAGSGSGPGFCSSFSSSVSNTGPSAFAQAPVDSAAVPNVTWTYTSASATVPSGSYLGRFSLNSNSNNQGPIYFSGQGTKAGGGLDGTVAGNTLLTIGPAAAVPIPEPATMMLLGMGLIAISWSHRKLSRR
jgi:hypothetical protein